MNAVLTLAEQRINKLLENHPSGFDLSLERISGLLKKLGNPQEKLPPVIHVAGTNGKGSTIAFMRAMLEAEGKRVHVHTSPHLVTYHERYRLGANGGGKLVSDEVLADAIDRVAKANDGVPITVFEILSAVAFVLFSEHPADVVLLEVGLGGRFDATNVIATPAVSVIAPVSLDHESYLGDRVELIAKEKAGIIKRGAPVIVADQLAPAKAVIEETALRLDSQAVVCGQEFHYHEEHGRLVYQDENGLLDLPMPALPGHHQYANAATAIAALRYGGFDVSDAAFETGMRSVVWPGRMQRLEPGKLYKHAVEGAEIWIDGGHNPHAGQAIASFIGNLEDKVQRPLFLIAGMLTTKDPFGYFEAFEDMARHVFTVPVTTSDAGFDPEILAELASEAGLSAEAMPDVKTALKTLSQHWQYEAPPRILICGSLYLVGDVLKLNGTPPQ